MTSLGLAELMSVFSLGADAGMGMPLESGQRTALLAVGLGAVAGLDERERRSAYYLGLLKNVGCVAETHLASGFLGGDEKSARQWFGLIDFGKPAELLMALARNIGREESLPRRAVTLVKSLRMVPTMFEATVAHCEVASMLARDCGCGAQVIDGLGQVFERWDGSGVPRRLKGEAISKPVRVVQLAHDMELFLRAGGVDAAITVARRRRGSLYDPKLVDVFVREARALAASLDVPSLWDAVIAAEPGAPEVLEGERLEAALRAMAGFADLPCRWTRGHSASVASLAESAARELGLEAEVSVGLRHAGYVHDLGRVGVTSSIWEKTGPLTDGERERVRMHSYFTERMLAKPASLAALGAIASLDHERLDGGGYHRRLQAHALPLPARVLAAADVYAALVDARPHRPAFSASQAAVMLEDEAREGRLDGQAVAAVLGAAGHAASTRRIVTPPNGLSEREVEVLCLVAVGMTNKEVAQRLGISDRTVGHHLQHVYDKLGVSTRAAAALFAQQRGLVGPGVSPHEG